MAVKRGRVKAVIQMEFFDNGDENGMDFYTWRIHVAGEIPVEAPPLTSRLQSAMVDTMTIQKYSVIQSFTYRSLWLSLASSHSRDLITCRKK